LADMLHVEIIGKFQIVTKPVAVEAAGTNCPKFLGSSGSPNGESEKSLNYISEMSSGLGRK
jgi:hypothetical protein